MSSSLVEPLWCGSTAPYRSFYSRGVSGTPRRTIWWEHGGADAAAIVIDQRRLPHALVHARWDTVEDTAAGIADMTVRGAPLIGVSAAYGMALAARRDTSLGALHHAADQLAATRPTAVNLRWALDRCLELVRHLDDSDRESALRAFAETLADEDVEQCRHIGISGLDVIRALAERNNRPVQVMTHCNAGRLACIELGTATSPIYLAHQEGIDVHVWVSETRPRNQGAALTAWELGDAGVPHTLVVDNAAGHLLMNGMVDVVIVGADRVAANGDTANKIGTSLKAYAAALAGVPFYVALPWSTFDRDCATGASIPIEERNEDEVLVVNGGPIGPASTHARNWGFDVTPARFVTGFLTPSGRLTAEEMALHAPR